MNIGVRQPSEQWHLGHLYQPRAYVPGSIMPSYPFLFEIRPEPAKIDKDEVKVSLPSTYVPTNSVVVARPDAVDLAKYLLALNRSYPVLAAPEVPTTQAPANKP
jgi:cytochrome c oxidase cbb3-type subunit II